MRTKEVTVAEGCKHTVAALTVDQVLELVFSEDLTAKLRDTGDIEGAVKSVTGNFNFVRERCSPVVAASLNNLIMGNGEWFARAGGENRWSDPRAAVIKPFAPPVRQSDKSEDEPSRWWTPQLVASCFDWTETSGLYVAIVEFTGLKSRVQTASGSEVAPASSGESKAVAIS